MFLPQEIIAKKRDNSPLTKKEIDWFIRGICSKKITEAQVSAFTMAVFFNKLSREELVNLTSAMRDSGSVLDWSELNGPVADKHSTGGIGDLTSLIIAPLLACCGVYVPMIAGRGLGHTGGTLDKLDSIPGYNTQLDLSSFKKIVAKIGCAIMGQTAEIAPADKVVYSVRDVTATTESLELITSSILSKKLAEGLQTLIMDVKTGNGAFLTELAESKKLAKSIVEIGNGAGCKTVAIITDMNQPLASSSGNALEIIEVINYLQNKSSNERLHQVILELSAIMLLNTKVCKSREEAIELLNKKLHNGEALEKFSQMVVAQGGPTDFIDKYKSYLPQATIVRDVVCEADGVVAKIDTRALGFAVVSLGGGRTKTTDKLDYSVGINNFVSLGETLKKGSRLATIHANSEESFNIAANTLKAAISLENSGTCNLKFPNVIYEVIQ